MGCDIHFYAEKKIEGKWTSVDKFSKNKYYDPKEDDGESEYTIAYSDRFYSKRNYDLFSILADVRNGYGFAGIDTGEGYIPIAEPKGIPEDTCDFIKSEHKEWDSDAHSASYFTVKELLEYDWTETTTKRFEMDIRNYIQWRARGYKRNELPNCYWSGSNRDKISESEVVEYMNNLLKPHTPFDEIGFKMRDLSNKFFDSKEDNSKSNVSVKAQFNIPYYNAASEFLGKTIPRLLAEGKQEDVRVVFWFDN